MVDDDAPESVPNRHRHDSPATLMADDEAGDLVRRRQADHDGFTCHRAPDSHKSTDGHATHSTGTSPASAAALDASAGVAWIRVT
jgi:hypothetical protein